MKVLVVEDNGELMDSVSNALTNEGFVCETCIDFASADEKIRLYEYDVLVVDINLPDGSGLQLIKTIKAEKPSTGIIVISARNSLDNKIEGLETGADDYLTKPFDVAELIARIRSLLRRRQFGGTDLVRFGDLTVDMYLREVTAGGTPIALTKSEYNILLFFLSNPNRVLTKESIAEHIWGDDMDLADSFDFIYSHIKNIRKKLGAHGIGNLIQVVYGIGYRFVPEKDEA